ncbi:MAG: extracellular solute-binding protein [Armatimonadetes bacterium]|nr:extracellular solute-binding protein [Armatimonadota bacterium]
MRRTGLALLVALAGLGFSQAHKPILIRMMAGPSWGVPPKEVADPRSQARRAVFEEFQRQNPGVRVVNAGGLELTGDRLESAFLMAMAGDTAPDVFYVNFRQYYNYNDQGFARPLDDLIAGDPASVGRMNPLIEKVLRSYDGKIYAMPWYQVAQALYYRKDHFAEAGLDPDRPPQTWEEFYEYGKRLCESRSGRSGFVFSKGMGGRAYWWSNFVWQAGGEVVVPSTSPLEGEVAERRESKTPRLTGPGEGVPTGAQQGVWKAAVATPAGAKALDFYRKLVTETWKGKNGKTYGPVATLSSNWSQDVADGKVSMWFSYTNDVLLTMSDLNPSLLGVAALPAGPAGRANEINAGMWAINANVKDPKKLEACWKFIQFFAGDEAARINTKMFVELGLGNLVSPTWLKKFGYADLAAQVDPGYQKANEDVFKTGHPEPYGRNCQQVYTILDNALDMAVVDPNRPSLDILKAVSQEMDRKLLGYTPPDLLERQRAMAKWILGLLFFGGLGFGVWGWLKSRGAQKEVVERLAAGTNRVRVWRFVMLCLLPAGLSVLVWSYYPLGRGLTIAFQDYRILGGSKWVGLDNFVSVFTQPIFWRALLNSFIYVALTIAIGFFLPILLALALNEIPRFKVFFRTVFYLPAMTSGIVIAFLWRQFYDKAETGLLNTLINVPGAFLNDHFGTHFDLAKYDWLGDPKLAMFAVVLPGIWAGAGPGSILYLAALKNISEERYEAADLDGANWRQKIRYITLPGLKPLILINLLGVFIAGFKAMENVFVLTGGGPLYSTHTIGLEIWTNAFMFLKFGYATAAAWVMGAILIGFTLVQIRSLMNVKFGTAKV